MRMQELVEGVDEAVAAFSASRSDVVARFVDEDVSVVSHFDVKLSKHVRHGGAEVRVRMIHAGEGEDRAVLGVVAQTIAASTAR